MRGAQELPADDKSSMDLGLSTPKSINKRIAAILLLFATVCAMAMLFRLITADPDPGFGSVVSVTGSPVCLPHKDTSGPTTLECALGLKGDDGRYYALQQAPDNLLQEDFGTHVVVKGTLNAPEADQPYDIVGTIQVQSTSQQ